MTVRGIITEGKDIAPPETPEPRFAPGIQGEATDPKTTPLGPW